MKQVYYIFALAEASMGTHTQSVYHSVYSSSSLRGSDREGGPQFEKFSTEQFSRISGGHSYRRNVEGHTVDGSGTKYTQECNDGQCTSKTEQIAPMLMDHPE
jgi:hypothetical protein